MLVAWELRLLRGNEFESQTLVPLLISNLEPTKLPKIQAVESLET